MRQCHDTLSHRVISDIYIYIYVIYIYIYLFLFNILDIGNGPMVTSHVVTSFQRCGKSSIPQGADREKTRKKKTWRGGNKLLLQQGVHKCCFSCVVHSCYSSIVIGTAKQFWSYMGSDMLTDVVFSDRWSIFLVGGYILMERVWKRLHGRAAARTLKAKKVVFISCWYHI